MSSALWLSAVDVSHQCLLVAEMHTISGYAVNLLTRSSRLDPNEGSNLVYTNSPRHVDANTASRTGVLHFCSSPQKTREGLRDMKETLFNQCALWHKAVVGPSVMQGNIVTIQDSSAHAGGGILIRRVSVPYYSVNCLPR